MTKLGPEEIKIVVVAPPDADPCWCCHYKDNSTGRCGHEEDCELLADDLDRTESPPFHEEEA